MESIFAAAVPVFIYNVSPYPSWTDPTHRNWLTCVQLLVNASTPEELIHAVDRTTEDPILVEHPSPLFQFCKRKVDQLRQSEERTTAEVVLLSRVASLHLDRLFELQEGLREARMHGASETLVDMISNLLALLRALRLPPCVCSFVFCIGSHRHCWLPSLLTFSRTFLFLLCAFMSVDPHIPRRNSRS